MFRVLIAMVLAAGAVRAEVHTLTLQQIVGLALRQNPELIIARLDERRAQDAVHIAKDPFTPKLYGGSGLAYTYGYPTSIEGSAPAIVELRTSMSLFNRPQRFQLAAARESARAATLDAEGKSEDVVYRTASLFFDARESARAAGFMAGEIENLTRVAAAVAVRVAEGREIPLESKRAALNSARARQRAAELAENTEYSESSLAMVLGFPAGDRVRAAESESASLPLPASEEAAVAEALRHSREIRRLETQLQANVLVERAYESSRYPVIDLVAQYSLLAKHNYEQFFQKFQRNNTELGVSITIPLLVGAGAKGYLGQASADVAKMQAQLRDGRSRVAVEAAKSYNDVQRAGAASEVARLDLDVAREQVGVLLAQQEEGRAPRSSVDQARMTEQEKWIAYYDAQNVLEKAQLYLLRETGTILAALR